MQKAAYFTKIYEKIIKNCPVNPSSPHNLKRSATTTPPNVSMSLDLYRHSSYTPPASPLPLIITTDYNE